MSKQSFAFFGLVVIVLGVAAGVYVSQQIQLPWEAETRAPVGDQETDSVRLQGSEEGVSIPPFAITAPISDSVEANQREALLLLAQAATDEEVSEAVGTLQEAAVPSGTMEVSDCVASPSLLLAEAGDRITVANRGSESISILLPSLEIELEVPADASAELIAGFGRGAGVYGFTCESASASWGGAFVVVSPL